MKHIHCTKNWYQLELKDILKSGIHIHVFKEAKPLKGVKRCPGKQTGVLFFLEFFQPSKRVFKH